MIERHRRRLKDKAKRITVDLDPTDDPTHGSQQLSFFNGHYDSWCYLPVAGFVTFNDEPEQYLVSYLLRPGNAPATRGAAGLLKRLLERLRQAFPPLRVRLDGGFASPGRGMMVLITSGTVMPMNRQRLARPAPVDLRSTACDLNARAPIPIWV